MISKAIQHASYTAKNRARKYRKAEIVPCTRLLPILRLSARSCIPLPLKSDGYPRQEFKVLISSPKSVCRFSFVVIKELIHVHAETVTLNFAPS